jgi:hypothetical protein
VVLSRPFHRRAIVYFSKRRESFRDSEYRHFSAAHTLSVLLSSPHQSRAQADPFIYSVGIQVAVQVNFNLICFIKGDSEEPMSGWPRESRPNASEVPLLCSEYRSVLLPKSAEILYSALPEMASAGIPYYTLRRIPSPGVPQSASLGIVSDLLSGTYLRTTVDLHSRASTYTHRTRRRTNSIKFHDLSS